MKKLLLLLFTVSIGTLTAVAQTGTNTIASADSISAKGMPAGMDIYTMAKVAVMHHCPLPDEVLASKVQLKLDAAQQGKLAAIIKTLNLKKAEISQSVRLNEGTLNQMFASRKLSDGALIFYGNRYGLYEGEMRTAVLTACYETAQVLTSGQIAKFEQIKNHND